MYDAEAEAARQDWDGEHGKAEPFYAVWNGPKLDWPAYLTAEVFEGDPSRWLEIQVQLSAEDDASGLSREWNWLRSRWDDTKALTCDQTLEPNSIFADWRLEGMGGRGSEGLLPPWLLIRRVLAIMESRLQMHGRRLWWRSVFYAPPGFAKEPDSRHVECNLALISHMQLAGLGERRFDKERAQYLGNELNLVGGMPLERQSPGTSGSADPLDALSQAQAQALAPAAPALPYEVLDVIASEARSDFQRLCDTVRLTAVHVKTAQHVSCIAFLFSDGTKRTHGGVASGTWREPLCLSPGEFLTRVSGEAGELLTAVRFDTSHGRSVRYSGQGSAGGVPFELQPPSGHEILDVSSRCSSIFRTVGGLQVLELYVIHQRALAKRNTFFVSGHAAFHNFEEVLALHYPKLSRAQHLDLLATVREHEDGLARRARRHEAVARRAEIAQVFGLIDNDSSGSIDFGEMLQAALRAGFDPSQAEELRSNFEARGGEIGIDEFTELLAEREDLNACMEGLLAEGRKKRERQERIRNPIKVVEMVAAAAVAIAATVVVMAGALAGAEVVAAAAAVAAAAVLVAVVGAAVMVVAAAEATAADVAVAVVAVAVAAAAAAAARVAAAVAMVVATAGAAAAVAREEAARAGAAVEVEAVAVAVAVEAASSGSMPPTLTFVGGWQT
ncbi:hypothetical protein EMIHUDRAFT_95150 [Emiliania huxleyi CCMP1516]|uniref:EF-hand domain-containing protein n=2 Tax=Emiliania huxleyi TaxID=2903 RepID=A0A0D3L1S8_EMIH1|nr:hypothetical protein EMIHUDRAFT_95150 [Emiliania huxleyi CCMP1516]EOD41963.1 hypothetical protein EMIHUDRAFT_95150 [Emiliania huxleyi CCMP1516]|eukprot:XP_005794392.1 hypothetical protein EMIHUDRAFT_95150 [Emiliania huxleyi CCMP1516]